MMMNKMIGATLKSMRVVDEVQQPSMLVEEDVETTKQQQQLRRSYLVKMFVRKMFARRMSMEKKICLQMEDQGDQFPTFQKFLSRDNHGRQTIYYFLVFS